MIRKWLMCSWLHWQHRCYPEVWKEHSRVWHCARCHPCSEELVRWLDSLSKSAQ
jgi:hypothetical protein